MRAILRRDPPAGRDGARAGDLDRRRSPRVPRCGGGLGLHQAARRDRRLGRGGWRRRWGGRARRGRERRRALVRRGRQEARGVRAARGGHGGWEEKDRRGEESRGDVRRGERRRWRRRRHRGQIERRVPHRHHVQGRGRRAQRQERRDQVGD